MVAAKLNGPAWVSRRSFMTSISKTKSSVGNRLRAFYAQLISGICISHKDDFARIERGAALFDDLYAYFHKVCR